MNLDNIAEYLQTDIDLAVRTYGLSDARSLQSQAGIIGPSDLGFCRQKVNLMLQGVEQSDAKPIWPAQVGTAVHHYVAAALRSAHPEWIVDSEKVTATFPSGVSITGTPDVAGIITALTDTEMFLVLDGKTKNGLSDPKRHGPSLNNRYQRHTYALGAIQSGLVPDGTQVLVGNLYLDRSGGETACYVQVEEFDDLLTNEIDEWIGDVTYARLHNEDAMRDVPAPVCERICEYFTVCRGNLPVDESEPIRDAELRNAIRMYVEGREMKNQGERYMKDAKAMLADINGTDGEWQVRWTEIGESYINGFTRSGYMKMDVVKAKRGAS